ncbi:MAG: lysine--tRNA ligase [Candidatus Taylorbacteria bacterium]
MPSLEEIRQGRLAKQNLLKEKGINPYPISTSRNHENAEVIAKFDSLLEKELVLAGRVMTLRPQGGLIFFNFFDGTATFQALLKKDESDEGAFELFESVVDIGDFVELSGSLFETKRKEKTLKVKSWRMLSKSLLPLPEKWHGLQDIEERFRKRYLDLLSNSEVRERFIIRGKLVSEIRAFYDASGYLEVETPVLQTLAGGATAEPFVTHHNALDVDFNLTIAQELYLKKLLIGGFNKVYEIGRKFRNEGIDSTHNPEFTMLESNEAYADAKSQREFIELLFKTVISNVLGKSKVTFDGNEIDLSKPFEVFSFYELLRKFAGIAHPQSIERNELKKHAEKMGLKIAPKDSPEKIMDALYKKMVRSKLISPTFIVDYPLAFNPFSKRKEDDPSLIDRFQLIIGGLEMVNAFSELNNPIDQKERYEEEDRKKKEGEGDISPSDLDYLEAMEYGMPPNGGIGIGIDRVAMFITDCKNIKEVILFPTLRAKNDK